MRDVEEIKKDYQKVIDYKNFVSDFRNNEDNQKERLEFLTKAKEVSERLAWLNKQYNRFVYYSRFDNFDEEDRKTLNDFNDQINKIVEEEGEYIFLTPVNYDLYNNITADAHFDYVHLKTTIVDILNMKNKVISSLYNNFTDSLNTQRAMGEAIINLTISKEELNSPINKSTYTFNTQGILGVLENISAYLKLELALTTFFADKTEHSPERALNAVRSMQGRANASDKIYLEIILALLNADKK